MVKKAIEVEFKFEVLHPEKVRFLEELEFRGEKTVNDIYLDTKNADLFRRGIFVRIRNGKTLDFKFNPEQFDAKPGEGIHEHCMEYNFSLPLQKNDLPKLNEVLGDLELLPISVADLDSLRKQNQWIDSQVFNKTRKKYAKPPFEYCLDEVENFGTFLEIEATTQDRREAEKLKEKIREDAQKLDLKLITTGYNELWWRKNDHDIYRQGKFLLEEDKPFYGVSGLIPKTIEMLQKKFGNENTGHDWEHFRRVWQMARKIALEEKANLPAVELAALLHDIADWKAHNGNRKISEETARKWLEENKVKTELVEKVCQAIREVSFKVSTSENIPSSLEGKIVQDADRLDSIGAMGIIRTIAYGAQKERAIYNPAHQPKNNMTQEEFSERSTHPKQDDTTINHFYEKLLLLKDRLHTKTAKKIAERRHRFLEQFLDEFYAEWNGKA